jgi:ribonuclease HII
VRRGKRFDPGLLPAAPGLSFEQALWAAGLERVAGVDEAGRGALAGPVAAGAVIFPPQPGLADQLIGVRDSKQMSPTERQDWAPRLREMALAWGVGLASAAEIDELGILPATRLAAWRALQQLAIQPTHLLVDYLQLPGVPLPQTALVKGDARALSIAAASILAKTSRDAILCELDGRWPGYGFAQHKGYGTPAHLRALGQLGPCPEHRRTFGAAKLRMG